MKLTFDDIKKIGFDWNKFKSDAQSELDSIQVENPKNLNLGGRFFNATYYSDITPFVIVGIVNEKTIIVEQLNHTADHTKHGGEGHQDWIIYRYDERPTHRIFTLRKNGDWVEKGESIANGMHGQISEVPVYRYDWSY